MRHTIYFPMSHTILFVRATTHWDTNPAINMRVPWLIETQIPSYIVTIVRHDSLGRESRNRLGSISQVHRRLPRRIHLSGGGNFYRDSYCEILLIFRSWWRRQPMRTTIYMLEYIYMLERKRCMVQMCISYICWNERDVWFRCAFLPNLGVWHPRVARTYGHDSWWKLAFCHELSCVWSGS